MNNFSKKPPRPSRSQLAPDEAPILRASTAAAWTDSRPRFLSPNVAGTRKSSVYSVGSESQSIMVFTDVEELISPVDRKSGRKKSNTISKPKTGPRPAIPKVKLFPPGTQPRPKPSRLDSLTPRPLKLVFNSQKKRYNDDTQAFDFLDAPYESLSPKKKADLPKGIINVPQEFPRRPRRSFYHPKRILRFTGLFPESRKLRPLANVDKLLPQAPYHVFDLKRKGWLTALLSLTALMSPLATGMYFPAIAAIAKEFEISNHLVLLTIAGHFAAYGMAPLLWNPLSERLGRRPILIGGIFVFIGANVGLMFVKSLIGFYLLRALQAFGGAPLPIIATSIIRDVSTGSEADQLTTIFGTVLLLSFMVAPVAGAAFTQMLGFRMMFFFLGALGSLLLIVVLLVLPETHRGIAGNGTVRIKKIRRPIWSIFRPSFYAAFTPNMGGSPPSLTFKVFVEPFTCFSKIEVLPHILFGAVVFAIMATLVSTTPLLLQTNFHFSILLSGTGYLPGAVGAILAFYTMIHRLRSDFIIMEARFKASWEMESNIPMPSSLLMAGFPIERARLRSAWWIMIIFIGTTVGYGFTIDTPSLIRPLILQFFFGGSATALIMINGLMISDLHPDNAISSAVHLVRFTIGSIFVGGVQLLFSRLGTGITFSIMGGIMFGFCPILILQWIYSGRSWEKRSISSLKLTPSVGIIV